MSKLLQRLACNEDGAAMVQAALALPIFLSMLWGIAQFGFAMFAQNGMQNALGDAARYATLCVEPTLNTGCRRPNDSQIVARVNARLFGVTYGSFGTPTVTAGPTTAAIPYITIGVSYTMPTSLIFVNGPVMTFAQTKRVYVTGAAVPAAT